MSRKLVNSPAARQRNEILLKIKKKRKKKRLILLIWVLTLAVAGILYVISKGNNNTVATVSKAYIVVWIAISVGFGRLFGYRDIIVDKYF